MQNNTEIQGRSPSQIHTVLSLLQLARSVPVDEYATLLHSVSWPSSVLMHSHSSGPSPCSPSSSPSPFSRSHTPIFESNDAVASVSPDGAHATDLTVFACPVGILVRDLNVYVDDLEASPSVLFFGEME